MSEEHNLLRNHNELRSRAVSLITQLAEVATERQSTVTRDGAKLQRAEVLQDIADRLERNQFTLAVVGEFSRGKSSMINALLGVSTLLPTAIQPSTAAITVIKYDETPKAEVKYANGEVESDIALDQLESYVVATGLDGAPIKAKAAEQVQRFQRMTRTSDANIDDFAKEVAEEVKHSGRMIEEVTVHYPSELLMDGVVLVDTPGIGSVNPLHGEATRSYVHRADAVIFLINTDPVISASECNFLTFLQDYVNRFLFAVTKIDRFSEDEAKQSVAYTRKTIQDYGGISDPPVYPISAKQYLDGLSSGDNQLVERSGFRAFVDSLELFLIRERGQRFVRQYVQQGRRHLEELRGAVELELQAVDMTLEDVQTRLAETEPELRKARLSKERIIAFVDQQRGRLHAEMMGTGNTDWIRFAHVLQKRVGAKIDEMEWNELQQASELLPIYVRDLLEEELHERLDLVSQQMALARREVVKLCRNTVEEMTSNIGFDLRGIGTVQDFDLEFDFNVQDFRTGLKKVGTITVGSTLALTIASVFLFGGVGAVVMVGGLLAGSQVTNVFKNRVRNKLKEELERPLTDLVENVMTNINSEVNKNIQEFRASVNQALDGAIHNVSTTLEQIQQEMESAEYNAAEKGTELKRQKELLDNIDIELNLLCGPSLGDEEEGESPF